ncbi:hypothetical protein Sme01_01020 [Sphaerisporangium melleum]|uniref:Histidine kinase/HSP90-like ATPase domain-containing protein n=1 Tax=Sphaerisporangium melleum TaxID=321316 RepID=A0A917VJQ7_9ACTN|nr:ATP-binding protein [Sphaerisporangium melleum]GGK88137.1 hypothetical protein GCM10007964_33350 [Sphaerisporangium melleum]GII67626.1 hypothetical protein Sme01_01020 [Sphaerisporangium melleum]
MTTGSLLDAIELIGSPESVAEARAYVREKLGAGHPALDDVTLLVSEVVTNSIVHSDSKNGGKVTLALADRHDVIHVDVVDAGGAEVPHVCGEQDGESGRGLLLVQAIAHRWDVHDNPAGRTVWFQVKYARAK